MTIVNVDTDGNILGIEPRRLLKPHGYFDEHALVKSTTGQFQLVGDASIEQMSQARRLVNAHLSAKAGP